MILKGEHLAEIGELLHGQDWRTWLGQKLERTERMIRYYETNEAHMPASIQSKLLALVREQRVRLEAWERDLEK